MSQSRGKTQGKAGIRREQLGGDGKLRLQEFASIPAHLLPKLRLIARLQRQAGIESLAKQLTRLYIYQLHITQFPSHLAGPSDRLESEPGERSRHQFMGF